MASAEARVDDDWNHRATVCAVGAAVGAPPVLPPICFLSLISRLTWHATQLGMEQDSTYPTGLTPTDSRALLATHFK
jgi:hypothetical protein|tara:strand:+ start:464 stop:694 length:231 start_codon:yes stop_codon:yes gene_type:complete